MRIFLDTASIEEIAQGTKLGVVSGITTNPTLIAKEGVTDHKKHIRRICSLVDGPVSAEVLGVTVEGMVREGREIATWAPNVVVKLPITAAGLEATSVLSHEGIQVNQTLCFSPNQTLLAALAGARFVSPFLGRLDDIGHDGMAVVADTVAVFKEHNLHTSHRSQHSPPAPLRPSSQSGRAHRNNAVQDPDTDGGAPPHRYQPCTLSRGLE